MTTIVNLEQQQQAFPTYTGKQKKVHIIHNHQIETSLYEEFIILLLIYYRNNWC